MLTPARGRSAPPGSCGGLALTTLARARHAARLLTPRPRGGRHRTTMPAATLGPTTRGACSRTMLRLEASNTAAFWPSARPSGRCRETSGFGLVRLRASFADRCATRCFQRPRTRRHAPRPPCRSHRLRQTGWRRLCEPYWPRCRGTSTSSTRAAEGLPERAADRADGRARATDVGRQRRRGVPADCHGPWGRRGALSPYLTAVSAALGWAAMLSLVRPAFIRGSMK